MYIGAIAKQTGATPKAIRLYEELGLLASVERRGSYRVYAEVHVRQVRLIRQAQALGFRLSELAALLPAASAPPDWPALLEHLSRKRAALQAEVGRLRALDAKLAEISQEIGACLERPAEAMTPDGSAIACAERA